MLSGEAGNMADSMKADVLKHYIAWATNNGFAVIDVNIPKFLTGIDVRLASGNRYISGLISP